MCNRRLEIGDLMNGEIVFGLDGYIVRVYSQCRGKGCDLRFQLHLGNGCKLEPVLNRLPGFKHHPLSEITNSQVGARRSDSPRIGLFHSSEDAHEGCFAATIWTDQTDAFAVADTEGYVFKDRLDAVCFMNMVSCKHRVSCIHRLKTKTEGRPSVGRRERRNDVTAKNSR
jgi:hypothetical protein